MEIWYTARNKYDPSWGDSWKKYIEESKLFHLKELVSLDPMLCESTFQPDMNSEETWKYGVVDDNKVFTECYNDMHWLELQLTGKTNFNFLAISMNPDKPCENIGLKDFKFLGYDLVDQGYSASALSNCGGFDETFLPKDINEYGLISKWSKAIEIRENLNVNNPEEDHADCYVWGIWRHNKIGKNELPIT